MNKVEVSGLSARMRPVGRGSQNVALTGLLNFVGPCCWERASELGSLLILPGTDGPVRPMPPAVGASLSQTLLSPPAAPFIFSHTSALAAAGSPSPADW